MRDKAAQIRANASRLAKAAERGLAAARASVETQQRMVEQMRLRGEDATAAEILLGNLREVLALRAAELERLAANLAEARRTPDWKLNQAGDEDA